MRKLHLSYLSGFDNDDLMQEIGSLLKNTLFKDCSPDYQKPSRKVSSCSDISISYSTVLVGTFEINKLRARST